MRLETLKSLPIGKAAGSDLINNRLLKELAQPLALPLSDLFNFSLSSGNVPHIWKQANVAPFHRKNYPSDASNYRPISFSVQSATFWKNVHKYLFNFFRDNNVITAFQSGFVKLLMRVRKFAPYFVIKVKPLIEFGIKVFFLNLNLQVFPDRC